MKFSKQTMIAIGAIAITGALVFSFLPFSPGISFALGVVTAVLAINHLQNTQPLTSNPDTPQSSKTLYVGNLPYRANENEVKKLFSEHGEVFAVRLMKDKRTGKRRGFGFVVMNSNDADTAIEQLNNKEYGQRTLKVREANEPKASDTLETE
ncbi:RNA recognition motif domain-containing protein [Photobacterium chitinilyticum]|uniref:RNA-binding protein n=1 Tax=Photobacterium chitinilyticum TaxID=2485123 RepID=A0A444JKB7_9GAMM|nr:RNA-binding protein [Photobacterium chitinilyticum]RWX53523.1 RNA-binding protein [Photobacterium chitinilyticum]